MDLLGLVLAGVAAAADLGGTHLESLSHLSFFFAGLADDFVGFIHLDASGVLDWLDGHCHDEGGGGAGAGILQFVSLEDLGVGVGVGVAVVVVGLFLGFRTTLLGHDSFKFGGLFDLYFGAVVSSVSEEPLATLL